MKRIEADTLKSYELKADEVILLHMVCREKAPPIDETQIWGDLNYDDLVYIYWGLCYDGNDGFMVVTTTDQLDHWEVMAHKYELELHELDAVGEIQSGISLGDVSLAYNSDNQLIYWIDVFPIDDCL
jgi:hypothetical protein